MKHVKVTPAFNGVRIYLNGTKLPADNAKAIGSVNQ